MIPSIDLEAVNRELEYAAPQDILSWAWRTFGPSVVASSSCQTQSVPLLHMLSLSTPDMGVIFVDTGFHFPETLQFRDTLMSDFGLHLRTLRPTLGREAFLRRYGELYRSDPDKCCCINKVQPLRQALKDQHAWISGIRRDQTPVRRTTPIVARQENGLYKISPLATWTHQDVMAYIHTQALPVHPLLKHGYLSVGCQPCTKPALESEGLRSGRWVGQDKVECGLHASPSQILSPPGFVKSSLRTQVAIEGRK